MQLCIDAADDRPGVALGLDGIPKHMLTWETQQNHSKELLPNIDRLLKEADRTKADLSAIFVDIGPGGYAALRVGVSVAKGLAHGLGLPIVGAGRLELDAWSAAEDMVKDGRFVAIHRAGRGELAWCMYVRSSEEWREGAPPRITKVEEVVAALRPDDFVTGDIDDVLAQAAGVAGASVVLPAPHRVVALAALGDRRLRAGLADSAETLVPMYLRAPAIGPQR